MKDNVNINWEITETMEEIRLIVKRGNMIKIV